MLKLRKILLKNKSGLSLVELVICSVLILVVTIAVANSFFVASESSIKSKSYFELLNQTKIVENILRGASSTASSLSTSYINNSKATFDFTQNTKLSIAAKPSPSSSDVIINLDKIKSIRLVTNSVGNRSRLDYEIIAEDQDQQYKLAGGIVLNNISNINISTIVSYDENKKFYIK